MIKKSKINKTFVEVVNQNLVFDEEIFMTKSNLWYVKGKAPKIKVFIHLVSDELKQLVLKVKKIIPEVIKIKIVNKKNSTDKCAFVWFENKIEIDRALDLLNKNHFHSVKERNNDNIIIFKEINLTKEALMKKFNNHKNNIEKIEIKKSYKNKNICFVTPKFGCKEEIFKLALEQKIVAENYVSKYEKNKLITIKYEKRIEELENKVDSLQKIIEKYEALQLNSLTSSQNNDENFNQRKNLSPLTIENDLLSNNNNDDHKNINVDSSKNNNSVNSDDGDFEIKKNKATDSNKNYQSKNASAQIQTKLTLYSTKTSTGRNENSKCSIESPSMVAKRKRGRPRKNAIVNKVASGEDASGEETDKEKTSQKKKSTKKNSSYDL